MYHDGIGNRLSASKVSRVYRSNGSLKVRRGSLAARGLPRIRLWESDDVEIRDLPRKLGIYILVHCIVVCIVFLYLSPGQEKVISIEQRNQKGLAYR
jgi:hypothetical protein